MIADNITGQDANDPAWQILSETVLSLHQAAQRVPPFRSGRPTSTTTVWRWIVEGLLGPDGARLHLEGTRIGGRWVTSVERLAAFAERLTASRHRPHASGRELGRPPIQRTRESERAMEELRATGIGTAEEP